MDLGDVHMEEDMAAFPSSCLYGNAILLPSDNSFGRLRFDAGRNCVYMSRMFWSQRFSPWKEIG